MAGPKKFVVLSGLLNQGAAARRASLQALACQNHELQIRFLTAGYFAFGVTHVVRPGRNLIA